MSSSAASSMAPAQACPNQTLYLNNLNTKLKKPELKRLLYLLFSPHGQILSIVALKTPRMRGQAFIVYKELSSAVIAMRSLQGYPFCDKSLRIQYALTRSEAAKEMDMIASGSSVHYSRKAEQKELQSISPEGEEFEENEEEEC